MRFGIPLGLLLASVLCVPLLRAQQDTTASLKAAPTWQVDQFRDRDALIELSLDRALRPGETLAMNIGTLDVSSLLDVTGTRVRFRPQLNTLSGGESTVTVFLVRDGKWMEVGAAPIKVRNRFGLDEGRVLPTIDVSVAAPITDGSSSQQSSQRQKVSALAHLGVESNILRAPWRTTFKANALAPSKKEERLQYGTRADDAPPVDLSDYSFEMMRGSSGFTIGNNSASGHRHLINGFSSRGLTGVIQLGTRASIDASVMNGSNPVGFNNISGLEQSGHRLSSARLNLEFIPSRPGGLHLDLSSLDGSVLPVANFNQGSVTDAEKSTGFGGQLTFSDASNRVQFSGGVARSRFINPADRLVSGDSTLVPARAETRTARFGEMTVEVLRQRPLRDSVPMDLAVVLRHERIDPLYRSLGVSGQADMQSNAFELRSAIGALAMQGRVGRMRDNLADINSILTSKTNQNGFNAAVPVHSLLHRKEAWYLPQFSYAREGTHQFGDGIPVNGEFTANDVPDQSSVTHTASLEWTRESTTFGYRWNKSNQDNEQPGSEQADISGSVHSISLGMSPTSSTNVSLEASHEKQDFAETLATQSMNRAGIVGRWKLGTLTEFSSNISHGSSEESSASTTRKNTELQFEATRAFTLYRMIDGQPQGRVFLRFGRVLASQRPQFAGAISSRDLRWTLNAGGSVRFY